MKNKFDTHLAEKRQKQLAKEFNITNEKINHFKFSDKSIITIVTLISEEGEYKTLWKGYSICSIGDNFSRPDGRFRARNRALTLITKDLEISKPINRKDNEALQYLLDNGILFKAIKTSNILKEKKENE